MHCIRHFVFYTNMILCIGRGLYFVIISSIGDQKVADEVEKMLQCCKGADMEG